MRFLALTTSQAVLLSLLTATAIVALYFLKHRRRRVVISSTLLWRIILGNRLDNSIFERLRRIVSMALAVMIGLLIVFALARPEIERLTGRARRVVIVLDTSPTMQARTRDGKT